MNIIYYVPNKALTIPQAVTVMIIILSLFIYSYNCPTLEQYRKKKNLKLKLQLLTSLTYRVCSTAKFYTHKHIKIECGHFSFSVPSMFTAQYLSW